MTDAGECCFSSLSSDLTSLILSLLPVPSLVRASAVCHLWNSLISDPSFTASLAADHFPWFFLYGLHNTFSRSHQSFAFDPLSNTWFRLPSSSFAAASGFLFTTAPRFFRFINIEDRRAVEIYDPKSHCWDRSPPIPADFHSGSSSRSLSSALFRGKLYVYGIYSFFVSALDLHKRVWSNVRTLRPPGVVFSLLMACQDRIVLAGLCNTRKGPSFNLWSIHEETMEFSEIAIMPQDLLYSLAGGDDDDRFASLKCVGLGKLVYVFSEEHHKNYPACVCEIGSESDGMCSWRRVPELPSPVDKFHEVIGFCSAVSFRDVRRRGREE